MVGFVIVIGLLAPGDLHRGVARQDVSGPGAAVDLRGRRAVSLLLFLSLLLLSLLLLLSYIIFTTILIITICYCYY